MQFKIARVSAGSVTIGVYYCRGFARSGFLITARIYLIQENKCKVLILNPVIFYYFLFLFIYLFIYLFILHHHKQDKYQLWLGLRAFPALSTCFPPLSAVFSRSWFRLYVFPRLAPVTFFSCFPAFVTSGMFYFGLWLVYCVVSDCNDKLIQSLRNPDIPYCVSLPFYLLVRSSFEIKILKLWSMNTFSVWV